MFDPTVFHPNHLADLRKSGLTDETISRAGYASVRPGDIAKVTSNPKIESLLAIPYPGDCDFMRYKVFPPTLKGKDGHAIRYLQPNGSGVHLYVPRLVLPVLHDPTVEIGIAEGEKKADKGTQESIPCTAIGGLWNWLANGRLLPDLERIALPGRSIVMYPDSDIWKKKRINLREAVYRLGEALEAYGSNVTVCALPDGPGGTKQGIDDYLCNHPATDLKGLPHIPLTHQRFNTAKQRFHARARIGDVPTPTTRGKKLKDLMRQVFPVPQAIVPQVILEGVTLLAGPPKIGKSRLALDMALATACGAKALGHIPVDPGSVLYISLEDPERRLQHRARALLMDAEAPDTFEYETVWPRIDDGGLTDLEHWIMAHPGAKLIVIDTLQRIRPKPKMGQGVYAADYEALQGLTDLAHRHEGLAIVVVHHTNKKKEVEDYMDLISGSTGLPGSADGFMVMQRKRGQEDAILHVVHRDLEDDQEHALHSDALTGGWEFKGPASQQPSSPEQRAILAVLAEAVEPMTPKGIAEVLSKKADAVRFLLWKMENAGLVDRAATGKYTIHMTTTNNTNTANNTQNANTTNSHERASPPKLLAALVDGEETANSSKTAPELGSQGSVSVVSGVSRVTHCETCGSPDVDEMNGHPVCMACLMRSAG